MSLSCFQMDSKYTVVNPKLPAFAALLSGTKKQPVGKVSVIYTVPTEAATGIFPSQKSFMRRNCNDITKRKSLYYLGQEICSTSGNWYSCMLCLYSGIVRRTDQMIIPIDRTVSHHLKRQEHLHLAGLHGTYQAYQEAEVKGNTPSKSLHSGSHHK